MEAMGLAHTLPMGALVLLSALGLSACNSSAEEPPPRPPAAELAAALRDSAAGTSGQLSVSQAACLAYVLERSSLRSANLHRLMEGATFEELELSPEELELVESADFQRTLTSCVDLSEPRPPEPSPKKSRDPLADAVEDRLAPSNHEHTPAPEPSLERVDAGLES